MKQVLSISFVLLLMALSTTQIAAQHVYVDADASAANPNGSVQAPFPTITQALTQAQAGDTIRVAGGTYTGRLLLDQNVGVVLQGGFEPGTFATRDVQRYESRIQGSPEFAVIEIQYFGGPDNPQHYEIEGFTIEGGQRGILAQNFLSGGWPVLIIAHNIIRNNTGLTGSNDYGGGVASASMLLQLRGNHIHNNSSGKSAGFSVQLNNPNYEVLIEDNIIENNQIYSDHGAGGGVQIYRGTIRGNIFRNNHILESYGWGGGLIIDGNRFEGFSDEVFITLSGNTYIQNSAPSGGGGLFIDEGANVRMYNERIVLNRSLSSRNGGLLVDGPRGTSMARTEIYNTTIAGNTGADWNQGHAITIEGGSHVIANNSIFWQNTSSDNSVDFYVESGSTLDVNYSIFQTGSAGDGAIVLRNSFQQDPLFANLSEGDVHVRSAGGRWDSLLEDWVIDSVTSPAVDAGDPDAPFDLEPDPNGGRVNLGAYGNTPQASKSPVPGTSVSVVREFPQTVTLLPAYPNPFNPVATIRFSLDQATLVELDVFDLLGRSVRVLASEVFSAGEHTRVFDASGLPSGIYQIMLKTESGLQTQRVILLK
jgi:hypothetical protein